MKYHADKYDYDMDSRTKFPFQIAYALSIHKTQGLEFDSVKIIITKETNEQITKNIFYTVVKIHLLRHTFATRCYEIGIDEKTTSK